LSRIKTELKKQIATTQRELEPDQKKMIHFLKLKEWFELKAKKDVLIRNQKNEKALF